LVDFFSSWGIDLLFPCCVGGVATPLDKFQSIAIIDKYESANCSPVPVVKIGFTHKNGIDV